MANTLGVYKPLFYAQEALTQLEKALGMAARVYRGYDEERRRFGKGDTINIRRPSTFTVQDAPSTAQDVDTETVSMTLNKWKEVKFKLTDQELSFSEERIIDDHIRPAAYALADDIDQSLCLLYRDIPWFYTLNASPGSVVTDITGPRRVMFDNAVPIRDQANMHYMVNGTLEEGLIGNSAFAQWQGAGADGVQTQLSGSLGRRYGMEFFANQNVQSHTAGVSADATGALTADVAKGATSIPIDAVTTAGTFKAGDTLVIDGNTQRYAITADATASGGAVTLSITPPLVQAYDDNTVVTITLTNLDAANLAFHRNAFALAMAPLSDKARELGAQVETITDPITGLSIRARMYYVGNSSEVHVALDVLYGVKTLDPNLACRAHDNA